MNKQKMKPKKLKKAAKKQAHATEASNINVTLREAALLGLSNGEDIKERPYVNLKHYWPNFECFSSWTSEELKGFSEFCRKLNDTTWFNIYKTGGSVGHKAGLGYTVHKNLGVLPENPELKGLSPDLTWFELRISGSVRVHGFRAKDAFFLVFLDREHRIYQS